MNVNLLENAVKFHGKKLFNLILEQNNCESLDTDVSQETDKNYSTRNSENL